MRLAPPRARGGARRPQRVGALLLCVLLGACADRATPAGERPASRSSAPRIGEPAPAYSIATLAGDSLVLGPSRAVLLLNVWATWCASCKEEFAHMDTLLQRHRADGLRVVAVSVDVGETALVRRTLSEYAVSFEAAHDAAGEIEQRFPALGVPASYLIDRAGRLRWRHVGVLPPQVDSVVAALVQEDRETSVATHPLADGAGAQ